MIVALAVFLLTYFLGSVNFAYLAGKIKGVDLRHEEPGCMEAWNVRTIAGSPLAGVVFFLDVVKGASAAQLAMMISTDHLIAMVGWLGVVCGHGWSLLLRFRGGKGLVVSMGALSVLSPFLLTVEVAIGVVIYLISRKIQMAIVVAVSFLPVIVYYITTSLPFVLISSLIAAVILFFHRNNISELRRV